MEHQKAIEMNAAEKYVLGELSGELREQYEEHYFDCPACALDVQTAAAFVATSQEIFKEKPVAEAVSEAKGRKATRWAGWLKPLIAIPAMAALVFMLSYEVRHSKKSVVEVSGSEQTLVASADFGLRGGDRGDESVAVRVRAGEAFGLHFDFTPPQTFAKYRGEVQDQAGRALMVVEIAAERINKEVRFVVGPGRLAAGSYALVVYGEGGGAEQAAKAAVAKFAFTVEIIP